VNFIILTALLLASMGVRCTALEIHEAVKIPSLADVSACDVDEGSSFIDGYIEVPANKFDLSHAIKGNAGPCKMTAPPTNRPRQASVSNPKPFVSIFTGVPRRTNNHETRQLGWSR
jgi:hypothetical protein